MTNEIDYKEIAEHSLKNLEENKELGKQESKESHQGDYSEFEQRCITMGWNPNGRKSASDWALDGISVRNEKITDMYKITSDLQEMMKKQEKNLYDQARADLEEKRKVAISEGNINKVYDLEKEQEEIKLKNEWTSHADGFVNKHSQWYKDSDSHESFKMQKACHEFDQLLLRQGHSPSKHFQLLEKHMQEEFPEYFNPSDSEDKPKRAQAVEGGSTAQRSTSNRNKYTFDDLNEYQKRMAQMFANKKIMTIEKYIEEQAKAGNIKHDR